MKAPRLDDAPVCANPRCSAAALPRSPWCERCDRTVGDTLEADNGHHFVGHDGDVRCMVCDERPGSRVRCEVREAELIALGFAPENEAAEFGVDA